MFAFNPAVTTVYNYEVLTDCHLNFPWQSGSDKGQNLTLKGGTMGIV